MTADDSSERRVLDEMLCFSMYAASRATTQAYRRLLQPWGLTYPQYLVLVELWSRGPLSVRELGDDLALDSGTLSPLLRRMDAAGILTRRREQNDGRVVTVALTARGLALRNEMSSVPAELGRCMGVDLPAARAMVEDLRRLTDTVNRANLAAAS
ncbi:MarR family transcriptional regulator [Microbacterium sp. NPDC089189]|uniref:MarR family winged helix-turn-helix transcriptional regulator n=1 Tax=Microbacterium sp. NPDC089189 TaxID=3154972 RepID=UPI00344126DE